MLVIDDALKVKIKLNTPTNGECLIFLTSRRGSLQQLDEEVFILTYVTVLSVSIGLIDRFHCHSFDTNQYVNAGVIITYTLVLVFSI